ncbi:MAG: nucleotidyltransferase domain-containing protein [Calditrichota bacterium]
MSHHFINTVKSWAEGSSNICGLAVVGSYARGTHREESDIDLIVVCVGRDGLLGCQDWIELFGKVKSSRLEDYGANQSLRVFYKNDIEVEFGLVFQNWLRIPLDTGTRRVLTDGAKILYDPLSLFRIALENIQGA